MSSRRLARAGLSRDGASRIVEGVPVELRDRGHELWEDPVAVKALARACGITLGVPAWHASIDAEPAWARFDRFRAEYCRTNGLMSARWPNLVDQRAARAAGIDMRGSALERARFMSEKRGGRSGR